MLCCPRQACRTAARFRALRGAALSQGGKEGAVQRDQAAGVDEAAAKVGALCACQVASDASYGIDSNSYQSKENDSCTRGRFVRAATRLVGLATTAVV